MEPDQQQLRNLRDFLLVYNRMTEICFQKCTSNFNYRNLTMDEERCVDNCAGKLIRSNHRLMGSYVQLMPKMMQRRMDEMETKAAEAAAATAAAPTALVEPPTTEASEASQTPIVTSSPVQPLTPSLTDVGPVDYGSVFKPAGLDHGPGLDGPVGLNAAVSASTMATDLKLSAAIPLTPVTEAVVPPVLKDAKNEPSYTGAFSLPPLAGGQIEAGTLGLSQPPKAAAQIEAVSSAQPVFTPSEPTSLPVTVPVSTLAAPTASISTGTLSAPEAPPPPGQ